MPKSRKKRRTTFRKPKSIRQGLRDGSLRRTRGSATEGLPTVSDDVRSRMCPLRQIPVAIMRIYGTSIPGHKVRLIQYQAAPNERFAGYFY